MARLKSVLVAVLVLVLVTLARADQTDIGVFSTTIVNVNNVTTATITNVPVNGQNKLLVVTISLANGATTVSAVNYNPGTGNVALTRQAFQNSSGNNTRTEIWTLTAPANAAAGTVTITVAAGSDVIAGAIVLNNVNQTTPVLSNLSASAAAATPAQVTGIGSSARQLIVGVSSVNGSGTVQTPIQTAGTDNMLQQYNAQTAGGSGGGTIDAAGGVQAGNITTFGWNLNAAQNWAVSTIVVQAPAGTPTLARYKRATAAVVGDHVRVAWATGLERENLGFRVFREVGGVKTQVSDLIAGSGLTVSARLATRGRTYAFDDAPPANAAARYFIEDVDRHGVKTWYGPLVVATDAASANTARASETGVSLRRASTPRRPSRNAGPLGVAPAASPDAMQLGTFAANATRATARERTTQKRIAGRPAAKISVNRAGWYRVSQAQLVAAGLPADVDAKNLALFADGREIAFTLRTARAGRFSSGDAIEFFGVGQDTLTTDRRVYWLTWTDTTGNAVTRLNAPGTAAGAASFPFSVERRDRTLYDATIHNGDTDNFVGAFLFGDPTDQALELPHPLTTAATPAQLTVALRGYSDNHAVAVAFNGHPLGVITWTGNVRQESSFAVPAAWLADGTNTVRLTSSPGEDFSAVEFLRVDYAHTFEPDAGALLCTVPGGASQTLKGFASAAVRVVDVSDPERPRELVGRVAASGGLFTVTLTPPGTGPRTLVAFTDDRPSAPLAVEANVPSAWASPANAGAIVMITHASFASALAPLRARRAAQNGSAVIVDVADLYDEFSFGVKDTQAIRDFLTAAAGWATPPTHVLIVGDATFNPRGFEQDGFSGPLDFDFVPVRIVDTREFETASDDWYVDRDGDGAADLPIGRLPVRTAGELTGIVSRLVAYETQVADPTWSHRVALVADHTDTETDFVESTVPVAAALPAGFTSQTISEGALGPGTAHAQIVSALDTGLGFLVYFGHATQEQWGDSGFFSANDFVGRTAGTKVPVLVPMTCLNGFFHDIFVDSLVKPALRANTGPVAAFACTGFCQPGAQPALAAGFVARVAAGATFGQAAVAAKRDVNDRDVRVTWSIFGDPSMRLR